jgi:hypothetical protein
LLSTLPNLQATMRFLNVLIGAAALVSTTVSGAELPSSDLEARYPRRKEVDNCRHELKRNHGWKFCQSFVPIKTVTTKKTVYRKKGTRTITKTEIAPCTTPGKEYPPSYYYGKREADAEADAEAHYKKHSYQKCQRKGLPRWLRKYSCNTIKEACRAYHYKPKSKIKTKTVRPSSMLEHKPELTV